MRSVDERLPDGFRSWEVATTTVIVINDDHLTDDVPAVNPCKVSHQTATLTITMPLPPLPPN